MICHRIEPKGRGAGRGVSAVPPPMAGQSPAKGRCIITPSAATTRRRVAGLLEYITAPTAAGIDGHGDGDEKCVHWGASGFDLATSVADHIAEMADRATSCRRGSDPIEHLVLSWRPGEIPTPEQVDQAAATLLRQTGYEAHQAVWALHADRGHMHMHVVMNRVTHDGRMKPSGWMINNLHRAIAHIEEAQGWSREDRSRYEIVAGSAIEIGAQRDATSLSAPARRAEISTGIASAQRMAQERVPDLKSVTTWAELHRVMGKVGLRYERKGSGAVIHVGAKTVKASDVARSLSLTAMEKRLGSWTPAPATIEVQPIEPVALVPPDLREEHQAYLARQRSERDAMKRERKERRQRKSTLAPIERTIVAIAEREERQRDPAPRRPPPASFAEWVDRDLGRADDAARVRAAIAVPITNPMPLSKIAEKGGPGGPVMVMENALRTYENAVGADAYVVTAIRMTADGAKKAMNWTARALSSRDGVEMDRIIASLAEIERMEGRGENLYLTPRSERCHFILVDDMTPDRLAALKSTGFAPAIVIESSPGNFQAILKIEKASSKDEADDLEKRAANAIIRRLNADFGDPKISGAIHPHRMPGTRNCKPKYAPSYPMVRIVEAMGGLCRRAGMLLDEIRERLRGEDREKAKAGRRAINDRIEASPAMDAGMPAALVYRAHATAIMQRMGVTDASRLDYMIAIRMRATGHSRAAIAGAILNASAEIATRKSTPEAYAARTADAAFLPRADRDIEKMGRWIDQWRRIEKAALEKASTPTPTKSSTARRRDTDRGR